MKRVQNVMNVKFVKLFIFLILAVLFLPGVSYGYFDIHYNKPIIIKPKVIIKHKIIVKHKVVVKIKKIPVIKVKHIIVVRNVMEPVFIKGNIKGLPFVYFNYKHILLSNLILKIQHSTGYSFSISKKVNLGVYVSCIPGNLSVVVGKLFYSYNVSINKSKKLIIVK